MAWAITLTYSNMIASVTYARNDACIRFEIG